MRKLTRLCLSTILCGVAANLVFAQQPEKPATASITGRITFDKQPLPGVTVVLENAALASPLSSSTRRPVAAKTDNDGRYRLTGIAAGQYLVAPRALAYVLPVEGTTGRAGRSVTVGDGEQIENMDFTLVRGGVIAGKITDHLDRPVIAQRVGLKRAVAPGSTATVPVSLSNFYMFETDDRGMYRLFGLQAGQYTLSVGEGGGQGVVMMGMGTKSYPLMFYPDARNEKEAKLIEVTEGGEVTGIDIKLPKPEKTYEAKGRVIDASTGAPLAGFALSYQRLSSDPNAVGAFGLTQNRTNAQGEFVLSGLTEGKYAAMLQALDTVSEYYADPITFELHANDVEGLEIKAGRGASIGGVIVVEGTTDPAILKRVAEVRVSAYPETPSSTPSMPMISLGGNQGTNPDGTFRVTGVRPGKNRLSASSRSTSSSLILLRIERDGVELPGALEIAAGEQITGIKVVMAYGASVIRGQVNIINGTLPPNTQVVVSAMRVSTSSRGGTRPAQVDTRGKFVLEGLVPGEYEVVLSTFSRTMPQSGPRTVRQKVMVGAGETPVTLTLDLSEKKEGQQ